MDYKIVIEIPRLCEYMFRKGIYDASLIGDMETIKEFTERDTAYHKPRFFSDFNSQVLKKRQYLDYLQMVCSTIEANNLRNYIAYRSGADRMKVYILVISEFYYRQGMEAYDGETSYMAKEALDEVRRGQCHVRKGKRITVFNFFDEVKYRLTYIEYSSESGDFGLKTSTLANAMGKAVLKNKMRSCE